MVSTSSAINLRKSEKYHFGAGHTGRGERHAPPPPPPHFFAQQEEKRETKGKNKDCHQGQNVTVLAILERLEFENFSCRATIVTENTFYCFLTLPL